jgi:large repetitive protein
LQGDVYLVPGDFIAARAAIYAIHQALSPTDISAPLGNVEQPAANATLSGTVAVSGWAFDNVALTGVAIYIDGVAMGSAITGGARPDVASAYPHVAPADSGWTYTLDSTKLANGPHIIVVHATDTSSNEAIYAPIPVTVSN